MNRSCPSQSKYSGAYTERLCGGSQNPAGDLGGGGGCCEPPAGSRKVLKLMLIGMLIGGLEHLFP